MDVVHTAIWVSDLEESRSFFVDTLGLSEQRSHTRNGVTNVYVGGEHGAIQLRFPPAEAPGSVDRTRYDHVALSVDTPDRLEAVCERVANAPNAGVTREPTPIEMLDVVVAFVRSPDGYAIELVADRTEASSTSDR